MLRFARRVIVEIVQPNLAPGNYFGMFGEFAEFCQHIRRNLFGFVRMDADRGINPVVRLGVRNGRVHLFRTGPGADRQNRLHARGPRPFEHSVAILRKLRKINVRV